MVMIKRWIYLQDFLVISLTVSGPWGTVGRPKIDTWGEIIMRNHYEKLLWEIIMKNCGEKISWEIILRNYWEIVMRNYHDKLLWENIMKDHYEKWWESNYWSSYLALASVFSPLVGGGESVNSWNKNFFVSMFFLYKYFFSERV